ncbi:ribosome-associated translation inhibitor RaiA [candidate division KSB1 bacterium]|nr:ribosome-associated translation inhibitor RaiA [candidate division KSB1 bacterium]
MRINITARHFKLSDDLRTFTEKEIQRLKKYFDQIIDVDVILEWQKIHRSAEIKVSVYGNLLTAQAQADEMHKAIINAIEKLERQLIKYKGKLRDFDHEKPGEIPAPVTEEDEPYLEEF